tara:strand:- start:3699 stop:4355 length:657 start_codon:yes stop_codon:yes gene_type:complete
MSSLSTQLENLQDGKPKNIRGVLIRREHEQYFIDDVPHSLDATIEFIQENGAGGKKRGFAYDSVAFLLVKISRIVSTHQIRDRKGHMELLEIAKSKKLTVYFTDVKKIGGKWYTTLPWIVDFESVDNLFGPIENFSNDKHKPKPRKVKLRIEKDSEDDLEEDIVDIMEKVEEVNETEPEEIKGLLCPFCDKIMNSTPGRTLHVKSKHPDKYDEYLSSK